MTVDERDAEFVSTLDRERAALQGTAYLLIDEPHAAANVLDAALAQLYARQVAPSALRLETLRSLVRPDDQSALLPWSHAPKFELVDGPPRVLTRGIVADLGRLPHDQRAVIVLERFTELPSVQIAEVLDRPVDEVLVLARQARAALVAGHPERQAGDDLATELRSAIPYDWQASRGGSGDLAHGHRLVRRRRWRLGSVAAAAAVTLVLLVSQLWLQPAPAPTSSAPRPSLSPSSRATCDTTGKTCQTAILLDWRSEMAQVTNSHLDPDGKNSFGYNLSDDDRHQTPAFWSGRGGALTLELFRIDHGVTQVSVQIATASEFALTCGETTHTHCASVDFMDGNQVTVTDRDLGRGLEVQFWPDEDQVITAIARNSQQGSTQPGRELSISRGELIKLVEDPRLRLPDL